ncbi:MAG: PorT family protein [Chitinispirillales bacterium]|jgi:opacity protein-like surface antigen|nr:PorT family protein [Chitinispirillales bacterium]
MKRFIVASCLAVVLAGGIASSANAQGLQFGVRAGMSMNMFSIDETGAPDFDMGFGFGGGLALKYAFTEQLSLNPEVSFYYRTLGSYSTDLFGLAKMEASFNEMAVSIPILVQYAPIADVPLYVTGGIQLDIPFSTKAKVEMTYLGETEKEEEDASDERASVDIGIAVGVGYMILPNLGVDFRYVFNVNQPFDEDKTASKSSLMSMGLGITYLF